MLSTGLNIMKGVQAKNWPSTAGRVLSVESKDTSDSESSSRKIKVRYSYRVEGRDYEGGTIHPAYTSSSIEESHKGLEVSLRGSKEVRVYYDGANPERSTLSVGFFSGSLALLFGGLIFFGAGVGFLLTFVFALAGDWDYARGLTLIP